MVQEGDPAGTKIVDVQYRGSGTVHLTLFGSEDFELLANGTIVTAGVVRGDQAGDLELTVLAVVELEELVTRVYVLVRVKATG